MSGWGEDVGVFQTPQCPSALFRRLGIRADIFSFFTYAHSSATIVASIVSKGHNTFLMAEQYAKSDDYKARVTALFEHEKKKEFPVVANAAEPVVNVLRYHHLGIACANVAVSATFYAKFGFQRISGNDLAAKGSGILVLTHSNGLSLHLLQADIVPSGPPHNVLMDNATSKAPGHTHASWTVPSVPAVKDFLAGLGVELSGTRSTLAVFVRDPDRTTLEFERNDGGDEPPAGGLEGTHVGSGKPLDHVGIRVRAPYDRHLEHYTKLGFTYLVTSYKANEDPLKNMPPWVTRSAAGCDINWIINANTSPEDETAENILVNGGLRPGILYAAFSIAEGDAEAAASALVAAGVDAVLDTKLGLGWKDFPADAVRALDRPTVLVRDLNGTILRLVPSE